MQGLSGIRIFALGLAIAVLGGLLFGVYHFFEVASWVYQLALWLMLIGGLGFTVGFGLLLYALRDPAGVHVQDANASFTALARCMVAMSIADGKLDDAEVKTITRIFELLTGEELDEEFVLEIAESIQENRTSLQNELVGIRPILTSDLKEKMIKASFHILAADGVVDENEERLLNEIREGLDFSKIRYIVIKKEFFSSRKKLRRSSGEQEPADEEN